MHVYAYIYDNPCALVHVCFCVRVVVSFPVCVCWCACRQYVVLVVIFSHVLLIFLSLIVYIVNCPSLLFSILCCMFSIRVYSLKILWYFMLFLDGRDVPVSFCGRQSHLSPCRRGIGMHHEGLKSEAQWTDVNCVLEDFDVWVFQNGLCNG